MKTRVAPMRLDRGRACAVAAAVVATGLVVACDVLVLIHHQQHWPHGFAVWLEGTVSLPIWLAIGLLLVFRVPGNVLGPIALGFALLDGMQLCSGALATYLAGGANARGAAVDRLTGVSVVAQMAVVGGLLVFTQLAPDGRLVTRRWRALLAVTVSTIAFVAATNLTDDAVAHGAVPAASAPLPALPVGMRHVTNAVSYVVLVVVVGGTVASLVVRWRRADDMQRQQLKLVVYAAVTAAVLGVVLQPIGSVVWPNARLAGTLMWAVIPTILPVSIAAAVLRYRLYDIDRIVSRTASYAVVTAVVVGGYVGLVALIESVIGFSSSVAVAASTLTAAAAFQPLRRWVQRGVDRKFDRAAYDARRTVDAFAARLRDQVDVDAVRADLLATASASIAPTSASLWVAS
jgi:hypothetical protein